MMESEKLPRTQVPERVSEANAHFEGRVASRPVPVIDLPHRRDQQGGPVHGSDSGKCPCCSWNGNPKTFYATESPRGPSEFIILNGKDAAPPRQECCCCRLLSSILHSIAAHEDKPVGDQDFIYLSGSFYTVGLKGADCHSFCTPVIFTTKELHGTQFDYYGIPRRSWTYADSLFGASARWARNRISECLQSHESCRGLRGDPKFLPSRLINVGAEELGEDVVLENRSSIPDGSPYVALSYCWGDCRPECMTTPETLQRNMRRIPWSTLPATFQDAVKFTRSLGVKYIWIDTICIIQGNREDWSYEAGKMFHVYGNAYVTLAALYGDSSASGLRSTSMESLSVKVAEGCDGQNRHSIYMRRVSHHLAHPFGDVNARSKDSRTMGLDPLLRRAWTYQERMVTPRVLYFDKSEIIFECFSGAACECGATQDDLPSMTTPAKLRFFDEVVRVSNNPEDEIGMATRPGVEDAGREKQQKIEKAWRGIVLGEYPLLALSFPSDRLPALGAIAKQFQKVRCRENYLAGLWSGSLVTDLLWHCALEPLENPPSKSNLHRPYSLPTWSWASLQTGISYHNMRAFSEIDLAEVVEAKCQYADENPFGNLEHSVLVLRGRVLHCLVEWKGSACSLLYLCKGGWTKLSDADGQELYGGRPLMDHDDTGYQNSPERQDVYLFEMKSGLDDSHVWLKAASEVQSYLILRREAAGKDIYSRAGVMHRFHRRKERAEMVDNWKNVWEEQSVLTYCEIC
ncbi:HET-domain-containing protein [Hypoxylon sp. FL0543]|nr:HET-domain-containing protein [Hypoxylon sp. FL0543]